MTNLSFDATQIAPAAEFSATLVAVLASRNWSTYQQNIFTFVASGSGNAIVEAVAGSGKSTTIVEAMKLAEGESIFLAFNKAIADELKRKGVNGRTFHSLVYGAVLRAFRQDNVTMDKLRLIQRELFSFSENKMYGAFADGGSGAQYGHRVPKRGHRGSLD
jgi:hypothetical protein